MGAFTLRFEAGDEAGALMPCGALNPGGLQAWLS